MDEWKNDRFDRVLSVSVISLVLCYMIFIIKEPKTSNEFELVKCDDTNNAIIIG